MVTAANAVEALRKAAARFREYEANHSAKIKAMMSPQLRYEIEAKAARNREMAEMCEQALASHQPPMQGDVCEFCNGNWCARGLCPICGSPEIVKARAAPPCPDVEARALEMLAEEYGEDSIMQKLILSGQNPRNYDIAEAVRAITKALANSSEPERNEWLSIASAPRDESVIWVLDTLHGRPWHYECIWNGIQWYHGFGDAWPEANPTHWMPLPKPPAHLVIPKTEGDGL